VVSVAGSDRPTDVRHAVACATLVLVAAMNGLAGRADGPQDNLPDTVRSIPPVGIELDETTAARLLAAADAIQRDAEGLAGVDDRLRSEAAVFGRAVRMAVEDRFFHAPKEVEQAEQLLQVGRDRLAAIGSGARGLAAVGLPGGRLERPTAVVGGFRSRIDGSVQPYAVVLPAGFEAGDVRPRRLDVWLHGRGEKVSEAAFLTQRLRDTGPVTPPDAIVLHPYGRYCNAFKFAGEIDVLEAIDHVTTMLPIDGDRVVMRGFSMGGAGCWQLAVHHPGRWMAATPGAGFSETREFLRGFQDEVFRPTDAQAALLDWYDCPGWANNLRTLPTIAYSGELDRQKQASDVMVAACRSRGFEIPHVIGAKMGHKIDPGSMQAIEAFLVEAAGKGRPSVPRAIDFTTYTLRYPRHTWLTIEGLGEHWSEARVRAKIASPTAIEIETTNVTRLRLEIPADSKAIAAGGSVDVRIDGRAVTVPPATSTGASGNTTAESWSASFVFAEGGWTIDDGRDPGLRKRPGLQGPIDDAFLAPFVFVGPREPSEGGTAVDAWVREEFARAKREWRRHFRGEIVERSADTLSEDELASRNLVLFGTPESNPLVAKVLPNLPVRREADDWVLAGHRAAATDAVPVLIYPNPLSPGRYVVLNSGFTYRDYAYLNNARQIPMLPDWALVSVKEGRGSQRPGRILAEGFFDERWRPQ
jgi:pimeloyl-ACP methyl ester carboxylesterase